MVANQLQDSKVTHDLTCWLLDKFGVNPSTVFVSHQPELAHALPPPQNLHATLICCLLLQLPYRERRGVLPRRNNVVDAR